MNNHNKCACGSNSVSYRPMKDKNGYAKSLHRICQNCGKDLTAISLRKRASTLKRNLSLRNSNRGIKNTYRRNRLVPGMIATLAIAVTSSFGFTALANSDGLKNEVIYQRTEQSISTSTPPIVPETKPEPVLQSKEEIRDYVLSQASSTGVWVAKIDHMVEHESHYDPRAIGDMQLICQYGKNKGKPVRARGIWQITDCGHPEITDEQAFDVKWSTAWALSVISKSQKDCRIQWTTCDGWYKI